MVFEEVGSGLYLYKAENGKNISEKVNEYSYVNLVRDE